MERVRKQMEWESQNVSGETQSGAQRHTNPSPLSTFNRPRGGLGGEGPVSLNTARQGGRGAGPGLPEGGACRREAGSQLHLQERTIMLDSCSTLALRPT